jgi:hypothetical protein
MTPTDSNCSLHVYTFLFPSDEKGRFIHAMGEIRIQERQNNYLPYYGRLVLHRL